MRLIPLIFTLIYIYILSSCTKSSSLGNEFVDNPVGVILVDTLSVIGSSEIRDSIIVYDDSTGSEYKPQYMSLGRTYDPVFGVTNSCIYTQLSPASTPNIKSPTVDSVFFYLAFAKSGYKSYGDTSLNMIIDIFRIKDDLNLKKKYYSDTKIIQETKSIGSVDYTINPFKANPRINGDSLYIKVPITDQSLINELKDTSDGKYTNSTTFGNWFKGVVIKASNISKSSLILDMYVTTGITSMRMYYKNAGDTLSRVITYIPNGVKFNTFSHERNGFPIKDFVNNTSKGDSLLFMQCTDGIDIKLSFPTLNKLKGTLINKAEIILPLKENPLNFGAIPRLIAYSKDTMTGKFVVIPDIIEGLSNFEGTLTSKNGEYFYRLTISRFIQYILKNNLKSEIYIAADRKQQLLNRSLFYGTKNTTKRTQLNILYSNY